MSIFANSFPISCEIGNYHHHLTKSSTEDYAVGGGVTEEAMGIAKTLWEMTWEMR